MRYQQLVLGSAAVALVATYIWHRRRRQLDGKKPFGQIQVKDKQGQLITIRLGRASDIEAVTNDIADNTGTGSGVGSDLYFIQEYTRAIADPNYTVLFAEDAQGKGLGTMQVVWSSDSESYWQMLRVAETARIRGIGRLLFRAAASYCVEKQGPDSISRWGVVSNNSIMTGWSARLGLHGPEVFRRYTAPANPEPMKLPAGYTLRTATEADVEPIMRAIKGWPVNKSSFGSQNFVVNGWANFTEVHLREGIAGALSRGIPCLKPLVLFDSSSSIVAFATRSKMRFGDRYFMLYRYADGEPAALSILFHAMPHLAHEEDCMSAGGYVSTLPWLLSIFDESSVFTRPTQTEQHEFHWLNADFC